MRAVVRAWACVGVGVGGAVCAEPGTAGRRRGGLARAVPGPAPPLALPARARPARHSTLVGVGAYAALSALRRALGRRCERAAAARDRAWIAQRGISGPDEVPERKLARAGTQLFDGHGDAAPLPAPDLLERVSGRPTAKACEWAK